MQPNLEVCVNAFDDEEHYINARLTPEMAIEFGETLIAAGESLLEQPEPHGFFPGLGGQ